jgi:hypothetical protein
MKTKPSRRFKYFNFQLVLPLRTFQTEQFIMLNDSESAISTTNI